MDRKMRRILILQLHKTGMRTVIIVRIGWFRPTSVYRAAEFFERLQGLRTVFEKVVKPPRKLRVKNKLAVHGYKVTRVQLNREMKEDQFPKARQMIRPIDGAFLSKVYLKNENIFTVEQLTVTRIGVDFPGKVTRSMQ
ncbi:hypothetical protein KIN20_013555 [Parelaphostrongylus tenuis]|uniref:Uncharacterized protein n=1 Tax=Parelaphostrongylus tenuis TaxID=148309 RepID=A0AAD5MDR6_PARTN|nr:hypothetical protein KIN20_013555 [Parelaphostrongylus tenuis]